MRNSSDHSSSSANALQFVVFISACWRTHTNTWASLSRTHVLAVCRRRGLIGDRIAEVENPALTAVVACRAGSVRRRREAHLAVPPLLQPPRRDHLAVALAPG